MNAGRIHLPENVVGELKNLYFDEKAREMRDEMFMHMLDHFCTSRDPLPVRLSQA